MHADWLVMGSDTRATLAVEAGIARRRGYSFDERALMAWLGLLREFEDSRRLKLTSWLERN